MLCKYMSIPGCNSVASVRWRKHIPDIHGHPEAQTLRVHVDGERAQIRGRLSHDDVRRAEPLWHGRPVSTRCMEARSTPARPHTRASDSTMLIRRNRKIIIVQQKKRPKQRARLPFVHILPWCSYRHCRMLLDVLRNERTSESPFRYTTTEGCQCTHFSPIGTGTASPPCP